MNSQQGPHSLPNHSPSTGDSSINESSNTELGSNISPSSSIAGTHQNPSSHVSPGVAVQEQVILGVNSSNTRISSAKRSFTDASGESCEGESSNMGAEDARAKRLATESHVNAADNVNSSPPLPEKEIFSENAIIEPIQGHHRVIQQNGAGAASQPNSTVNGQAALLFRESSHSLLNLGPLTNLQRSLTTGPPFLQTLNNFSTPLYLRRNLQLGTLSGHQIRTSNIPTSFPNHPLNINSDDGASIPRNPSLHFSEDFNRLQPLQIFSRFDDINRRVRNARAFMNQQPLSQQAGPSSSGPSRQRNHSVDASNSGFQPQEDFANLPFEPLLQLLEDNGTTVLHDQAISNQALSEEAVSSQEIVHSGTENYNNQVITLANQPQVVNVESAFPVHPFPTLEGRNFSTQELSVLSDLLWFSEFPTRNQEHYVPWEPRAGLNAETIMHHIRSESFISEDEDNAKCVICYEDFEDGDEIAKLDLCVHKFHIECIKRWLMERNSCPICKQTALTMNDNENEVGVDVNVEDINV